MNRLISLLLVGLLSLNSFGGVIRDNSGVGNDMSTRFLISGSTAAATTFKDIGSASNPKKVITAVASATWSSAVPHFGKDTIYLDGSTDCLTTPQTAEFQPTVGQDWTLDGWFYLTNIAGDYRIIYEVRNTGTNDDMFFLRFVQTTGVLTVYSLRSGVATNFNTATSIVINKWTHIACVKKNNKINIYFNGVQDANSMVQATTPVYGSGTPVTFGRQSNADQYTWIGYMADVRVSNYARWTRNFTPPSRSH